MTVPFERLRQANLRVDEEYESNGYFYTYDDDSSGSPITYEGTGYYPQAGINFLFGLSLKF